MAPAPAIASSESGQGQAIKRARISDVTSAATAAAAAAPDESPDSWYNPDQDEEERRRVRTNLRENAREFQNRRDELLKPDNSDILDLLERQDEYMRQVRQTADAAIDSRFLVAATDLTLRKTKAMTVGSTSAAAGIDVDDFVTRCLSVMRKQSGAGGRKNSRTSDGAQQMNGDDMTAETTQWHYFGSSVCQPAIGRSVVVSHLLGPLSVQKRARAPIVRRVPLRRTAAGEASRPEELTQQDMTKNSNSDTPTLCRNIHAVLVQVFTAGLAKTEEVDLEEMSQEDAISFLAGCNLASDLQVPLLKFALNPESYGQTIENLFYISFMIKDGGATLGEDADGLPTIRPVKPKTEAERRQAIKDGISLERHQLVLSLDWPTWEQLVKLYQLTKPWIPHRSYGQETNVRGWYG